MEHANLGRAVPCHCLGGQRLYFYLQHDTAVQNIYGKAPAWSAGKTAARGTCWHAYFPGNYGFISSPLRFVSRLVNLFTYRASDGLYFTRAACSGGEVSGLHPILAWLDD
ncbi:hypothetical protein D3C77_472100 [compost metagenome]